MLDPAKPFATKSSRSTSAATSAKADLSGLLDRARDERFRLLKMLKDARAEVEVTVQKVRPDKPQTASAPTGPRVIEQAKQPAETQASSASPQSQAGESSAVAPDQLQNLITKLTNLDAQLDAKLLRVHTITDEKIARLEQVESHVTAIAQQLGHALADGRMIQRELIATVERADTLPDHITGQLERFDDHIAAYQTAGQDAFQNELQRLKESMLGEVTAELGRHRTHLDTQLAEAHAIAEREIVKKFDHLADTLHGRADQLIQQTESTADAAMKRIRKQVVDAMARAHDTQEAFKSRLDQQQAQHREHLASLTDAADGDMQVQAQRLDESMTGLAELFESQADQILAELRERATTLLDQMAAAAEKLTDTSDDRRDGSGGAAERQAA